MNYREFEYRDYYVHSSLIDLYTSTKSHFTYYIWLNMKGTNLMKSDLDMIWTWSGFACRVWFSSGFIRYIWILRRPWFFQIDQIEPDTLSYEGPGFGLFWSSFVWVYLTLTTENKIIQIWTFDRSWKKSEGAQAQEEDQEDQSYFVAILKRGSNSGISRTCRHPPHIVCQMWRPYKLASPLIWRPPSHMWYPYKLASHLI